ncbi:hypothetical protein JQX13_50610 [Archangium violaceum]|uniref:hypothetical protein n=1 Tax=Archangium violaceum TaxID=83451 RepID=UPI00193BE4E8|nr:hypothetical protein [Archangium violaceum]QRK08117.1 hypothetical protein JQX13_50610 [Archangium violaceum]
MAGWIGLYVDEPDIELLREHLNDDPEIAFILPEGQGRWRAAWRIDDAQGQTMLWHVPGGPLPLLGHGAEGDTFIEDPFVGWTERRAGRDRTVPYFGPSCPSALLLSLFPPGWRGMPRDSIPVSGLGWYGRMTGVSPLPPAAGGGASGIGYGAARYG